MAIPLVDEAEDVSLMAEDEDVVTLLRPIIHQVLTPLTTQTILVLIVMA